MTGYIIFRFSLNVNRVFRKFLKFLPKFPFGSGISSAEIFENFSDFSKNCSFSGCKCVFSMQEHVHLHRCFGTNPSQLKIEKVTISQIVIEKNMPKSMIIPLNNSSFVIIVV